jgi:hypothetical protein
MIQLFLAAVIYGSSLPLCPENKEVVIERLPDTVGSPIVECLTEDEYQRMLRALPSEDPER